MRRTKEEAEKTKIAILDAAETLFLKKGVSKTSLEEIARATGMTRGAVYWHFKNKDHLINELISQILQPVEQVFEEFMAMEGSVIQKLFGLFKNIFDALSNDEQTRNIFTILLRRCEYTEELSESEARCNNMIESFISHCARLISEPETAKRLRPDITPDLAAHMLHIMTIGVLNDWARDPKQFSEGYNPDLIIKSFFRGIFVDWE
ncbi:TetR family transcriptional regulator [Entomomonas asaccharolytica]|uniref:TetR family transcriptional regulator n=1 Tax=Entomomonas asaccharolytica TaxID=2785331 RepID=A0A974NH30_9GAMM|nr:TetR family transcriptional regulator [Entomomonas asaccharolytica]QQP86700.1 TetR family transcriptional regulator [Entomomonas asaccharolytica]